MTHGLGEVVGAGVGVVVGGAGVVGFKHLMYKQLSVALLMSEMNCSTKVKEVFAAFCWV